MWRALILFALLFVAGSQRRRPDFMMRVTEDYTAGDGGRRMLAEIGTQAISTFTYKLLVCPHDGRCIASALKQDLRLDCCSRALQRKRRSSVGCDKALGCTSVH
jgi:hypothetical protein